ncbi:hypothetical protein CNMCM6106_003651 [Aspergillus hiratsukae]|uniref:Uncharacterized protein n=1 Tax=Aspergillus hiratsukae TaxID=1194566 RepID=A0A8H6UVF5_9EURO|nr:hypothetical protein CNMCM6106_003651 [Aspergillus hiratsukae]
MGMSHTVKCVFRLTFLLKKAERSFHQKGKAVDHSHSAVPSLPLPNSECSDPGLGPLCKETGMHDYDDDVCSCSCTDTNTDTDTDASSVSSPDLAVKAQPADADADAGSSSSSSSTRPHTGNGNGTSNRKRLVRIVSFKSIAHDSTRWSSARERELAIAEHELARCQKAWSSEQELWLEYMTNGSVMISPGYYDQIKILLEEKEAHEEFLSHRAKQAGDERVHFRKAWKRSRAGEEQRGRNRTRSRSGLRALRGSRSGKGRGE